MDSMTRDEMREWFNMRGCPDGTDLMEALLDEYAEKTLDEMDSMYEGQHGSMA